MVARYQELYADLGQVDDAFRLLTGMEATFETWAEAAEVAIESGTVQISPDALRGWTKPFRAWLDNQAGQRDAFAACAGGEPITELTLIGCLDTVGPVVHRGVKLSDRLNTLLNSEPILAETLGDMSF